MAKDLYQILGVARDASAEDVKKTYRKLAGDLHPDRNPDPSAAERFKEVSAAYAVLGDEEKRKTYDEFGPDGLRDGFDAEAARNYQRWAGGMGGMGGMGGGMPFDFSNMGGYGGFGDLGDLLGSLFGGGGMPRPQVRKGADLEGQAVISVRQAIEGTELGVDGGKVRVPKGVAEGQRIRLSGRGQQGAAGRGDLYITVKIATPPGFEREGDDLTLDVPLRVSQAIAGGQVEVPTPEGTTLKLRVPAGSQSGQRMRLRGKGLPKKGGERGHLYARLMIRVPTSEDPELSEAAESLDRFYDY